MLIEVFDARTHPELVMERNPFSNWTQSQFNKYIPAIINGNKGTEAVPFVDPWTAIAKEFTDADPNAQQAENVADATWNS